VYKIIDGTNIITYESWDFDRYAQLVTLKDPIYQPVGGTAEFSSEHANLTVVYIPGRPVTETYLAKQALLESTTLLNEGTPPVPKQHVAGNLIETLTSHGATQLSLSTASTFALDVVRITDQTADVMAGDRYGYTSVDWTFNQTTQVLTLNAGLAFTTPVTPLTVEFTPRKSYLVEGVDPIDGTPYAHHVDPAGTYYRDLKFITVDNGGDIGLIATIGENTIGVGQTGFIAGEGGDVIYSPMGTGAPLGGVGPLAGLKAIMTVDPNPPFGPIPLTIGSPVGGSVFACSGSKYTEVRNPIQSSYMSLDLRWPDGSLVDFLWPDGTLVNTGNHRWDHLSSWSTMTKVSGNLLFASGGNAAIGGTLNDAALF
ncbi:MAG: hypothetical protein WCO84_07960, partial [bacterium]